MRVVVPPQSAARLTCSGGPLSPDGSPGLKAGMYQAQCTCGSMPPGMTMPPPTSITRAA